MNEPTDDLVLNKRNYTFWRLRISDQLQKRQWFSFTVNEDRSNRPAFGYHNRTVLRERKEECLQYLFSKVNLEIYQEIKHFDRAHKVWSYLQNKYSKNSMRRLNASMKELQTMRFNLESLDLFTEKFRRAVRKVEDCGLQLDDSYLNLYFLASLERCNRIQNPAEFYTSIDCKFDAFLAKIKDQIINPPDIEYSDISDDSMLSFDEEDDSPGDVPNETNGGGGGLNQLPSLMELNAKIDQNLQQYGVEGSDWESDDEKIKPSNRREWENGGDSKEDYKDARDQVEFDRMVNEFDGWTESKERQGDKRAEAFPSLLSPIKTPSQATKVSADEMETENNDDNRSKVYEDLNPANYDALSNEENSKQELETAISSITGEKSDAQTESADQPEAPCDQSSYFYYDRNGSGSY